MQFLIETVRPATPADRGRQVALCPTLADVREIAADLFAGDQLALAELGAMRGSPEGELRGERAVLRFAPRRLAHPDRPVRCPPEGSHRTLPARAGGER